MQIQITDELSQEIKDITFAAGGGSNSELVKTILLLAHPVGSYYWSSTNTNPHDLFGGTWTQIKDKFVIAVGDSHEAGKSYGSNSKSFAHTHGVPGVAHTHSTGNHTLTVTEMPTHSHSANNAGGHSHNVKWDGFSIGTGASFKYVMVGDGSNWGNYTDTKGSHSHTINNTGGGNAHNHGNTGSTTPSATTTNSQSVSTLDVTPACVAAYCWKRTA